MTPGVLEEERSWIIMATKGASNRYGNNRGSRGQGRWVITSNMLGLEILTKKD